MPFPEVKRVIYTKNPLDQVICQLKFPPMLKIDAEVPADYQDMVRKIFPDFSETIEPRIEQAPTPQEDIPAEILSQVVHSTTLKNYEFSSDDGLWKINLTRTFIALTAKQYESWEKFKDMLEIPLKALVKVYSPTHLSRIGLRYINVLQRSAFDLDDVDWTEILQPYILGISGKPEVKDFVRNSESVYEISLSDRESKVRMITGFTEDADSGETCYMVDSDFFGAKKIAIKEAMDTLDDFNKRAFWLFRWCITDRLHKSMEPQKK